MKENLKLEQKKSDKQSPAEIFRIQNLEFELTLKQDQLAVFMQLSFKKILQ
jgi:hypothetical protein